jgi:hypothetical protein
MLDVMFVSRLLLKCNIVTFSKSLKLPSDMLLILKELNASALHVDNEQAKLIDLISIPPESTRKQDGWHMAACRQ